MRKKILKVLYIRSNVEIVILFINYGQTSRALKTRVKEHSKAIATLDKNSLLAKHILNNHQIDLQSVRIVDRSLEWKQRLILEAWHSMRDNNAINEHVSLPNVYKNIRNF